MPFGIAIEALLKLARVALEDKAKQLALSSKYKSEFLANMSHELRTPLNSIIGFADLGLQMASEDRRVHDDPRL